jgi:hypothetical protein
MNHHRLEQLHEEDSVFLTDGAGEEWAAWCVEFAELWSPVESPNFFHEHCVALLEGSESLAAAFTLLVPLSVTEESFWCRYLHARRCVVPHELALYILESDPTTFTFEPNDINFINWKDSFFSDWEQVHRDVATDCEFALEKSQLLSWQYGRLVPASISTRDFWCRYLYRRAILVRNSSNLEHDKSYAGFTPPALAHAAEIVKNNSDSEGVHSAGDVSVLPLPQIAASTSSCEASLSGNFVSPMGNLASHDAPSSILTPSESVAPTCQDVPSSSHVILQGPSSQEVDGWDEWE